MLDAGANVDVRADHLVQFAYMGSMFMESVHGVERPRVGLLSIGEEPKKGTPTWSRRTSGSPAGTLNFVGNVEGGDIVTGELDVVVTDGFTGNVALKAVEGTPKMVGGDRARRDPLVAPRPRSAAC